MRILVADDQFINRRILCNMLQEMGYDVVEAANGSDALRILQDDNAPSIVLLDWEMPDIDGPDVCRQLRAREAKGLDYKFILLATGHNRREDRKAGFEAGADDYIVKPFDVHEIHARVKVGERIVRLQEKLRFLATRDELTGIFNRRTILGHLQIKLQGQGPLGVAIVDLDHFKNINDTLGHLAGDQVLIEASQRMNRLLPQGGLLGRTGGEEFLLVFHPRNYEEAWQMCEHIRAGIGESPVLLTEFETEVRVTASVGFIYTVSQKNLETLLSAADYAMYEAKRQGRNRVVGETR